MSNDVALKELEDQIKDCKQLLDLGSSLERLLSNRDFKKVVLEGYFREEAIRLVSAKADPALQSPESQASIVSQIDALGNFRQYLTRVEWQAGQAAKMIADCEQTREEILAEGDA